jgi:membrane-bound lytic murein transglycosylase B
VSAKRLAVIAILAGFAAGALAHQREASRDNIPIPVEAPAEDQKFYAFLDDFRDDALNAGIKTKTYDRAVDGIALNARVQELNQQQPEFVRPIWDYLAGAVSDTRVSRGQDMLAANAGMFARLEKTYGVQREILAAIWGIETGYGESEGGFNLFEALATLAYDGPRTDYGRTQFIAALKVAQAEHLNPQDMSGSWAGAIGHTQFVPTTFLDYAVDGDGDGKRDLWNSPTDALASTANYLKNLGWHEGEPWGEEVQLPTAFAYEEADPDIRKARDDWAKEGVLNALGQPLKGGEEKGSIFLPAGYRGPAFLTFGNFEVLQQYNASATYALAIGILSDRLRGGGSVMGAWPTGEQAMARDQMTDLQSELTALGYDAGPSDGLLGKRTRSALRAYQKAKKLPADGFPTMDLFYKILEDVHAKGK